MEDLTMLQLRDFAIVAIAIMGFIVLLGNVIKVIKDWRKPGMSEAKWREDVNRQLGDNSERIDSIEECNKVVCKALIAMLSHEINGNSIDKLKKAMQDLQEYLIDR